MSVSAPPQGLLPAAKNECIRDRVACANTGIFNTLYVNNIIPTPPGQVITEFPNTGDGTAAFPVTFAAAPRPCQTFFWDGTAWNHNRNPGITEVTVGNVTTGANFATIQEAFNLGCNFVRVVDTINEPAPLVLPQNAIIYVDPGITLILPPGQIDATGRSLTLMGNASLSSSTIEFNDGIRTSNTTYLYVYNCRVMNNSNGALVIPSGFSLANVVAYNATFGCSDVRGCLFGQSGGTDIGRLYLQNCVIEGGGNSCSEFITGLDPKSDVVIRGLVIGRSFERGSVLANTTGDQTILNDIFIEAFGSGTLADQFNWITNGIVSNFRQDTTIAFVNLQVGSGNNFLSNILVETLTVLGSAANTFIENIQITSAAAITLSVRNISISNGLFARLTISGTNDIKLSNCTISSSLQVLSSADVNLTNSIINSLTLDNSTRIVTNNCRIATFNLQNVSFANQFSNCVITSNPNTVTAGCINNNFSGGRYEKVTIDGERNIFSGIHFTSTLTISGALCKVSNCQFEQMSLAGPDIQVDNCECLTSISLGVGGVSPRVMITNCRLGQSGANGCNLDVNLNNDVVISNCIIGLPGGSAAVGIIDTIDGAPAPTITLIANCKQRLPIPVAANWVNCSTL